MAEGGVSLYQSILQLYSYVEYTVECTQRTFQDNSQTPAIRTQQNTRAYIYDIRQTVTTSSRLETYVYFSQLFMS
jgi:hypothetical protein